MRFLLIILAVTLICYYVYKKTYSYILDNSKAIKEIKELNSKYNFYTYEEYKESNTYDNHNFYEKISCQDYLIYQLQFKKYDVTNIIKNVQVNKLKFKLYCNELNDINCFGGFVSENNFFDKLKNKYLNYFKRKIFNKLKLKPVTEFKITVELYCEKMNGYVYEHKKQVFYSEEILGYIKRINNRNGTFYNDKDIWDSISRVERGKVTNKIRFMIYKRDGYRCQICGRGGQAVDLEIDHIKPIAKGGKSTIDNLQTLCKRCNKEKGDTY